MIVKFEDESGSYVHGFEAGGIWQQMQDGVPLISPDMPVHSANKVTFERMAKAENYTVTFKPVDGMPEWVDVTFEKIIRKLSVVPTSPE